LQTLTLEQQAVAEANDAFYAALTSGDLAAMDDVWFPADWTECVHPGWTAIRGWSAVRESWRMVFEGSSNVAVSPTDVRVRIVGDVAWVSCLERIATTDGEQIHTSQAQALNLFVRHDGRWRMAVHHASSVPFLVPQASPAGGLVN
jgi:uncharacterized protein (TIGR02246 family)